MTKHPITEQHLVLQIPEMQQVSVERDVPFGRDDVEGLRMDIYRPQQHKATALPVVLLVTGYSDKGAEEFLGCKLKDMAAYIDWARLFASAGFMAITYSNVDPLEDVRALIAHIKKHADSLGADTDRMAIWSCSGNTATALAVANEHENIDCAALCYGYLIDTAGHKEVAGAAEQFGFCNATANMKVGNLRPVPLLIVRAGRDETLGLNVSLDRFIAAAIEENLPITVVNQSEAPHAFDITDDSENSRAAIYQILDFVRLRLGG